MLSSSKYFYCLGAKISVNLIWCPRREEIYHAEHAVSQCKGPSSPLDARNAQDDR